MQTQKLNLSDKPTDHGFLELISDQRRECIEMGDFTSLGRNSSCQVTIDDPYVSNRHANIERKSNKFILRDLRSRNGTFVNGTRIIEAPLCDKDRLRIGQFELLFSIERDHKTNTIFTKSKNLDWNKQLSRLPAMGASGFPVLLTGPSGSGKEILAKKLHRYSARNFGPFISINCSALSENLIESELFGHVKGSFTGAEQDRKGAFEAARGGTLFLDEIGDLPLNLQPKLLRALENEEIKPVGSDKTKKTNVRIISASHHTLRDKVAKGQFREDLYFRLNVLNINPPPLRRRLEDFDDLIFLFARSYRVKFNMQTIKELHNHTWPGNIRELKNFVARASAIFPDREVTPEDVAALIDKAYKAPFAVNNDEINKDRPTLKDVEKNLIFKTLFLNKGNQRKTADDLGIPKSTLHDRIRSYKLNIKELLDA